MDPQSLNIGSLLTAARMLEKGQLLNGFTALNITLPAAMNIPTSASDGFFQEFQENVQPSMSYGKLRHERKCSSASTSSMPYCPIVQRKAPTKTSRAAHNELEKTRRANLRCCLEKLKSMVPPVSDAARNTTLALLTRAKDYIQDLDVAGEQMQSDIQAAQDLKAAAMAKLERLREEKARLEECVSRESNDSRVSPVFLEYSPSTKPSYRPVVIDPVAEGLLPALPISFPRPTLYPFFDLNPLPASHTSFLPIHLSV